MTYDPNDPNRMYTRDEIRNEGGYGGWAIGALLVLLLIGAVFMFGRSDQTSTTASNTAPNRPAAIAPANPPSTTGSGTTTPAPNPNR